MALALFHADRRLRRMVLDTDKTFAEIVVLHHNQPDEDVIEMDRDSMPSIVEAQEYVTLSTMP